MSSYARFNIVVRGFDGPESGLQLLRALQRVLEQQGFTQENVFSDLMGDLQHLRVEANTTRWVLIDNASQQRPEFERQVTSAMQALHADASVEFDWSSRPAVAPVKERILLSMFLPGTDGRWVWSRVEAISGEQTELTTLPEVATPVTHGLRFDPRNVEAMLALPGQPFQLYRIALADGRPLELPAHRHEYLLGAGYDSDGRAVLFYGDNKLERVEAAAGTHWLYEGQTYPISPDDFGPRQNMLASVYRVAEGGGFELVERCVISQTWGGDLRSLEHWATQHWASFDIRLGAVEFIEHSWTGQDPWCQQWGKGDEYIEWYRSERGARKVFFRAYREARGLAPPFVVETESGLQRLPEWEGYQPYNNDLEGHIHGNYLLIVARAMARLHRLDTGTVVWEAPPKARVALWPLAD